MRVCKNLLFKLPDLSDSVLIFRITHQLFVLTSLKNETCFRKHRELTVYGILVTIGSWTAFPFKTSLSLNNPPPHPLGTMSAGNKEKKKKKSTGDPVRPAWQLGTPSIRSNVLCIMLFVGGGSAPAPLSVSLALFSVT